MGRFGIKGRLGHDLIEIFIFIIVGWSLVAFAGFPLSYMIICIALMLIALLMPKIRRPTPYIYSLFSWFFGIISILILLNYTIRIAPFSILGEPLVLSEIDILPGVYLKPITLLMFSIFLWYAFGLYSEGWRRRFASLTPDMRRMLYIFAWLGAMASAFEIMYHIVIWSAALSIQGMTNPDIITNIWPNSNNPINVVFASKIVILIFAVCVFMIDYLKKIESK